MSSLWNQSTFLLLGHPQLPVQNTPIHHSQPPQPPTLWSVSRFQILTEVEDINSEGSYGGEEGGGRGREYLMRWTFVVRKRVTDYLLQKLSVIKEGEHQRLHIYTFWQLFSSLSLSGVQKSIALAVFCMITGNHTKQSIQKHLYSFTSSVIIYTKDQSGQSIRFEGHNPFSETASSWWSHRIIYAAVTHTVGQFLHVSFYLFFSSLFSGLK